MHAAHTAKTAYTVYVASSAFLSKFSHPPTIFITLPLHVVQTLQILLFCLNFRHSPSYLPYLHCLLSPRLSVITFSSLRVFSCSSLFASPYPLLLVFPTLPLFFLFFLCLSVFSSLCLTDFCLLVSMSLRPHVFVCFYLHVSTSLRLFHFPTSCHPQLSSHHYCPVS